MQMSKGQLFAASALALVLGISAPVQAATTWTNGNGDNDFANALNWADGIAPTNTSISTVNLAGAASADVTSAVEVRQLKVGVDGAGNTGEVNILGGSLTATNLNTQSRIGAGGGTGTVNQSGGTASYHFLQVGLDNGSTGTYNLSGGTFIGARETGGNTLFIGENGTGAFNVTGGDMRTRAGVRLGTATTGVGTFFVQGTATTQIGIGSEGSVDGRWLQNSGSTLKLAVDGATAVGVTHIFIDEVGDNGGGDVTFENGSILDLSFFQNAQAGSWDVMSWEGTLTDNGLTLSGTTDSNWSFAFVDTGGAAGADTLRITYTAVPEPASLSLMGLGGLMLAGRRRKA